MKRQGNSVTIRYFSKRNTGTVTEGEATTSLGSSASATSEIPENPVQPKRPKVVDHPLDIGRFARGDVTSVQSPLTAEKKHKILTNC